MKSLVSTDWLAEHLDEPTIVVLAVVGLKDDQDALIEENETFIPGTRIFDLKGSFKDQNSPLPNTVPSPADFQNAVQALGINQNDTIILYDRQGVYSAPRAWWLFKVMGHDQVQVLDGGLPKWKNENKSTQSILAFAAMMGNFTANYQDHLYRSMSDIQANVEQASEIVLDARSEGRFKGTAPEPRAGLDSGHIPGSKSLPFTEVVADGQYKSEEELQQIFQDKVSDDQALVFSCGSGITACIIMLAADQVTDRPKALFDGSWTEWASTPGNPITQD